MVNPARNAEEIRDLLATKVPEELLVGFRDEDLDVLLHKRLVTHALLCKATVDKLREPPGLEAVLAEAVVEAFNPGSLQVGMSNEGGEPSTSGAVLPPEFLQGLQELIEHQRKKARSISISSFKSEHWEQLKNTAHLNVLPLLSDLQPTTARPVASFGWDDQLEKAQAWRYIPYLQQVLRNVLNQRSNHPLTVVDAANHYPTCLQTRGLEDVIYYNFNGTTDVLLALAKAAAALLPESASVSAWELKKNAFRKQDTVQACITLLLLNFKSRWLRPWVLLTDLGGQFIFYWLDQSTIYYYQPEDAAMAWGIVDDLLTFDSNVTFQDPPADVASRLAIMQRRELSEDLLKQGPAEGGADLTDFVDDNKDEVIAVRNLLHRVSLNPVLGPMIPSRPLPVSMYT